MNDIRIGMASQLTDGVMWCDYSMMHEWLICPRMFYWHYIRGQVPRIPSPALSAGAAWHRGMASLWQSWNPAIATAEALDGYDPPPEDPRSPSRIEFLLHRYVEAYPPEQNPWMMLLNENVFSVELADGLVWRGRVDKVLQHRGNGNIVVMDHKTTSRYGHHFFEQFFPSWQLTGYQLGAERLLRAGRTAGRLAPLVEGMDILGEGRIAPFAIIDVTILTYANVENPLMTKSGHPRAGQKTWRDCFHRAMPRVTPFEPSVKRQIIQVMEQEMKPAIGILSMPSPTDAELDRFAPQRPGEHSCDRYGGCPYRELCRSPQNIPDFLRHSFEFRQWDPEEASS